MSILIELVVARFFGPFLKSEDLDFEQKGNNEYKSRRKTVISGDLSSIANSTKKSNSLSSSNLFVGQIFGSG